MIVDASLGCGSGVTTMEEIERHVYVSNILTGGKRVTPGNQGITTLMTPVNQQLSGAIHRALAVLRCERSCSENGEPPHLETR
jgi:hypothetical protein